MRRRTSPSASFPSAATPRCKRAAFTVVEITITVALFAVIASVLMDVMTSENKSAAALIDDLTVNNEARAILAQVAKDVRSATEVVLDPPQINPPANTIGIDERLGKLTLRYAAPSVDPNGNLKRFQIEYRLVGKTQSPPPSIPKAKAQKYNFLGQGEKWVFPLLRETAVFETGNPVPRPRDLALVGWVRELAFYQAQPSTGIETVSLPTVYLKLVMSAFKPGPAGTIVESYREEFSTGVTARSIVPSISGRLP